MCRQCPINVQCFFRAVKLLTTDCKPHGTMINSYLIFRWIERTRDSLCHSDVASIACCFTCSSQVKRSLEPSPFNDNPFGAVNLPWQLEDHCHSTATLGRLRRLYSPQRPWSTDIVRLVRLVALCIVGLVLFLGNEWHIRHQQFHTNTHQKLLSTSRGLWH